MVVLFDQRLSADAASIDTGAIIPPGYRSLEVLVLGRTTEAVDLSSVLLRFNNDSGSTYDTMRMSATNTTVTAGNTQAGTSISSILAGANQHAGAATINRYVIPFYDDTAFHKHVEAFNGSPDDTSANNRVDTRVGRWRNTAAITQLSITAGSGNLLAGTRMIVYGLGGANVAETVSLDGWTNFSGTWTYASASTFTVTGDATARFSKGTRIKLTQTTVKYFVVTGSSHSSGTTTVTVTAGSDYTLANATITDPFYSYQANPQGYPGWFNYTPTYGGFSADPPTTTARFSVVGAECSLILVTGTGTSNSANFDVTLPVASVIGFQVPCRVVDNGVNQTTVGKFNLPVASVNAGVNKDLNSASFTASGSKSCTVAVAYSI